MNGWQDGAWLKPAATVLAGLSIVLLIVNAALSLRNESAQNLLNQRQQYINQSAQVSRVAMFLVQTIAKTAVASKDDALFQLLQRHGVKLQPNALPDLVPPGEAK